MDNIVGIIKPKGITSHDVIDRIRRITGIKKVGHAGTLDPLATGVLVVAIGREGTKKINTYVKKEKEYVAEISLDALSSTGDEEGEKTSVEGKEPTCEAIQTVVNSCVGIIDLVPPVYSAIKVNGVRAYKHARKNTHITLEARPSLIKNIEVISYAWPHLSIRVVTGPGVYIRSLAEYIGKQLGVGGYLTNLERTRVGDYTIENSESLKTFSQKFTKDI